MRLLKTLMRLLVTPLPWFAKGWVYRLTGARIGEGASIAALSIVIADDIDLGPHAKIKPLTIISRVKRLSLEAYAGIGSFCVVNGRGALLLGPRAYVSPGCMIDVTEDVRIGEFSGLGPRCTLMTHGAFWPWTWGLPHKFGPIEIGNRVWVNFNCKIGPGVRIADGSLVLTGTSLSSDVRRASMVADTGLKRDRHPIDVVHEKPSRDELVDRLRRIIEGFHRDVLAHQHYEWQEHEGGVLLKHASSKRSIFVHLMKFTAAPPSAGEYWLCGYDVDEATLTERGGVVAMDFLHMLYAPRPGSRVLRAARYCQSRFGLRFADARFRECFNLTPPEWITEALADDTQSALRRSA